MDRRSPSRPIVVGTASSLERSTSAALPVTETALMRWLATAKPGDEIAYHRGFLAVDRSTVASDLSSEHRRELQRVSARALVAVERGQVHAVQRRLGDNDYAYLLIIRPRRPVKHTGALPNRHVQSILERIASPISIPNQSLETV